MTTSHTRIRRYRACRKKLQINLAQAFSIKGKNKQKNIKNFWRSGIFIEKKSTLFSRENWLYFQNQKIDTVSLK